MMAVCSFLGHRHIYGHDVQLRLQAAVNHLVEENDSVEFLLYLWKSTEPFYALCLLAALRAKQCAPQKVTLTLVADRLESWNSVWQTNGPTRSFSSRTGCFRFPYPKTEIHSKS